MLTSYKNRRYNIKQALGMAAGTRYGLPSVTVFTIQICLSRVLSLRGLFT